MGRRRIGHCDCMRAHNAGARGEADEDQYGRSLLMHHHQRSPNADQQLPVSNKRMSDSTEATTKITRLKKDGHHLLWETTWRTYH